MSELVWELRPGGTVLHAAPEETVAGRRGVHLWASDLDRPGPFSDGRALSDEERQRAARLWNPEEKARFVHRRAFLRAVLGSLAHAPPDRVVLTSGRRGKLRCSVLGVPPEALPSDFSVAGSSNVATVAVAFRGVVGVDLEAVRGPLEPDVVRTVLRGRSGRPRNEGAVPLDPYRRWTRAEALAKLDGRGIATRPEPVGRWRWVRLRPFVFALGTQRFVGYLGHARRPAVGRPE